MANMECAICYKPIVDKVSRTCSSQHPFCFQCVLSTIEANAELGTCASCRGGDKFIMLNSEINTPTYIHNPSSPDSTEQPRHPRQTRFIR